LACHAAAVVVAAGVILSLVVATLPLFVRTGPGPYVVERVLARLLAERVPGSITVGHLRGSVAAASSSPRAQYQNHHPGRGVWFAHCDID
jgi:hypothetical protein